MAQGFADSAGVLSGHGADGHTAAVDSGACPAFFYGWIVAVVAALGLASGISVFLPSTIGLLVAPLGKEFGWSPPEIIAALTFNTGATLIFAPLTGKAVDRIGARRVVVFALACQAALIASFYIMSDSLVAFYARYVLFAVLATGTTAISYSALISRWFNKRRGLALGVALAGVGFGGALWSVGIQYFFGAYGWRTTMLFAAILLVVVILPIQFLLLRDRPEQIGLAPDGLPLANTAGQAAEADLATLNGLTLAEAICAGKFWLVLITFFLTTAAAYGVTLNLVTILTKQGMSLQTAASAQGTIWLTILVGRVGTGWLLDRFFAPRIAMLFLIPGILGTGLLAAGALGSAAFGAALLVGLSSGAEIDVLAYLVGRYFGLKHFASIYAVNFGAAALATSVGPVAAALIASHSSYTVALIALMGVFAFAGVLLLLFPPFPQNPEENLPKPSEY